MRKDVWGTVLLVIAALEFASSSPIDQDLLEPIAFVQGSNITITNSRPSGAAATVCKSEADCNFQGRCVEGLCLCDGSHKGPTCKAMATHCVNSCSGHGKCVDG
jgi:hypothetical protein